MSKYKTKNRRARILVAEDDRTHQKFVETMLEEMGFDTTIASNGEVAIDLLQSSHFDLILMDCNMPVMSGYEAARKIADLRSEGKIADIPIIALTANQREGDPEKCFEAGMDDYIAKSLWMPKWKPRLERIMKKWIASNSSSSHRRNDNEELVSSIILSKTQSIAGKQFDKLVSSYLSETKSHISKMRDLAQARKPVDKIVLHACALVSSSRQIGAVEIAHIAEKISRQANTLAKKQGTTSAALMQDIIDLESVYGKTQALMRNMTR